jgi:hypothetical protein
VPGAIKPIGLLEIAGGLSGLATVLWLHFTGRHGGIPGGNVQFALLPFALLTTAGVALLRSKRVGIWLSLAMQAGQLLAWTAGGTMWRFSAGPFLTLTLLMDKTSIFAGWNTSFGLGKTPDDVPASVSINVISAVLMLFLWRLLEKTRSQASSA